jgi:hypothetical protein
LGKARDENVEVQQFLAQEEPCLWSEFMKQLDERAVTPHFEAEANSTSDILDPPFCRLTLEGLLAFRNADGTALEHPTLAPLAAAWAENERQDPGFSWLLEQPAWVGTARMTAAMSRFQPTLTLLRVHLPDGRGRVLASSRTLGGAEVRELLAIWSVVRRAAGVQYSAESRLCHHIDCPHYESNYCNTYPLIPERFEDCTFPSRIAALREM